MNDANVGELYLGFGVTPEILGLSPLQLVDHSLLRVLTHLTSSISGQIAANELVPQLGLISTHDLGGRMPAEVDVVDLLDIVGIASPTALDETVVMAISDTYESLYSTESTVVGLHLSRSRRRWFLYSGRLGHWAERLHLQLGPGTFPDLVIAVEAGWAIGIEHGTASVIARAQWKPSPQVR